MTHLQSKPAAWRCLGGALLFLFCQPLTAQEPAGLDDYVERTIIAERPVLAWTPVREADILWEKRLWRVIDTREKRNLPFVAPEAPLFTQLVDAARAGDLAVYSTADDRFTTPLSSDDLDGLLTTHDTIVIFNVEDYTENVQVVVNDIDWADVRRYRIKEAWYFDARTSQLHVRILGIAPLIEKFDDQGNFRFEAPLFWVHYPSARPLFARWKAIADDANYAAVTTWEDLFERRQFASCIYKENNLHDRRLEDYLAGTDLLLEARKINDELFNREHDLWQY